MYSHRRQKLICRTSLPAAMPRRRLLQGAGALGVAAILRPTAVFAEPDDDNERLGPFGPWSAPVNLGRVINQSRATDLNTHPAISKNGLSLYISSTRPGVSTGLTSATTPLASWRSGSHSAPASKPPGGRRSIWMRSIVCASLTASAAPPMLPISQPMGTCRSSAVHARVAPAALTFSSLVERTSMTTSVGKRQSISDP